jgi:hypothetical protein
MNGDNHGYGIMRSADGDVYYGEWKKNKREGHGYFKWAAGDYYCGEYKNNNPWGEGVSQENGQLYKIKFEEVKVISRSELPKVVKQK